MEATISLAVGDKISLVLPKMFVSRRRDPTVGTVDNISSNIKLDVRHNSFNYFLQPTYSPRASCKGSDESADVDSSISGQDDIKW